MANSTNSRRNCSRAGRASWTAFMGGRRLGWKAILAQRGIFDFPTVRIITCNVNGLRAADRKGFTAWMLRQKPDLACLQEIKAQESDLTKDLLAPRGLHGFFHPAQKRGYSGVAIYARKEPGNVTLGLGVPEIDAQGRFLQLDFGALSVVSLYMPS